MSAHIVDDNGDVIMRSTVAQLSFIDWAVRLNVYKYIRQNKLSIDMHNKKTVKQARSLRDALQYVTVLARLLITYYHNRKITKYTPSKRRLLVKNKKREIFAGTSFFNNFFFEHSTIK